MHPGLGTAFAVDAGHMRSGGPLVNHAGARGGFAALAAIVGAGMALLAAVAAAFRRMPVEAVESV